MSGFAKSRDLKNTHKNALTSKSISKYSLKNENKREFKHDYLHG